MTQDIQIPSIFGPFRIDVSGEITIEWDAPIPTGDGLVLRADMFHPSAPGASPVILSHGPYGKGRPSSEEVKPLVTTGMVAVCGTAARPKPGV